MLSTRIFPASPNWAMNISLAHLDVPKHYFVFSIFFGLMCWNFLTCQAGVIISTFKSKDEIMKSDNYIFLIILALLALLPPLIKKMFAKFTN